MSPLAESDSKRRSLFPASARDVCNSEKPLTCLKWRGVTPKHSEARARAVSAIDWSKNSCCSCSCPYLLAGKYSEQKRLYSCPNAIRLAITRSSLSLAVISFLSLPPAGIIVKTIHECHCESNHTETLQKVDDSTRLFARPTTPYNARTRNRVAVSESLIGVTVTTNCSGMRSG